MVEPPKPDPSSDTEALRGKTHHSIAEQLERSSDEELVKLLSSSPSLEQGHAAVSLPSGDAMVFVKLLPITPLELLPQNRHSTANIFELPNYYQYRIGSCGFGAWRELEAHRLASDWVTSGQCPVDRRGPGFPVLYHWRLLPILNQSSDEKTNLQLWGDCPAIHRRVSAINEATSSLALFLEYIPLTLSRWLRDQLARRPDPVAVVTELESRLAEHLAFVHAQGLLHMDAHFDNFLIDGERILLTDFGLALSREFELDANELQFLESHRNFDLCTAITSLTHAIVTYYHDGDSAQDWRHNLRLIGDGVQDSSETLPDAMRTFLIHRTPLALAIGEFYGRLLNDLTTSYPTDQLQDMLNTLRNR